MGVEQPNNAVEAGTLLTTRRPGRTWHHKAAASLLPWWLVQLWWQRSR